MQQNWQMILEMVRHDPAGVLGFGFLGAFGALFVHIQIKMRSVGYQTYPLSHDLKDYRLPFEYLRIRAKHGWSPWPAYLVWPFFIAGCALLIYGLFHLAD
ncbi:MAG TPA: hypothetical protein VJR26_11710 [Candidatus Acidoferrales bacterium]|nr:hypothetical protein [Candidatus Acidoferrales bacterium]